ncbi:coiled-coil domain-containing protein 12 [Toxorhynchites rutilus septentrionalis]|uniref:coiled-coil domain-containing protein 12 n=1 Tax=Toxorhynchites rutilus septentrionalis TaxID=329112 RepID=UPI00247B085D|nr:coiled-coil domain-containing protein 12 [Toxorhynchites rutilus septentrionalis]
MTDSVGKLEEEALKRKERLKNLKRKIEASNSGDNGQSTETIPKPVFRNYRPESEEIKECAIEEVKPTDVVSEISSQLEMMKAPIVIEEIDIANLAPRKPDWDLKRDVSGKLEKLERRTQKAIAELILDRLKSGQEDILQAVNVASATITSGKDDEE